MAEIFRLSAEQGQAEARYHLGICIFNGDGAAPDKAEGVRWIRQAAEQGHPQAKKF
ncbi:MAG: hypothetical protein LBP22_16950 [Deltaproteobacteria bacterium]|nr:hypothetical protein [Deltaproteobacteria bacterium]